ncbi:MAG: BtrH N-terminal domain-containing protein, partial [Calditrichaceae bacterium]
NTPAGVQVDFFYMDYVPEYIRAHFNGHFVIVVGKNKNKYLISDAYTPVIAELDQDTLMTARFTRGPFKPKGLMIYRNGSTANIDWENAIKKGIKKAAFNMLQIPLPFLGVKGIRYFAKKLSDWPKLARDEEHLSDEVMMINILLEERGTGGGGFRFMYAAFLQEAAKLINKPDLNEVAEQMMNNGDEWRLISLFAGKIGRNRDLGQDKLQELGAMIEKRADVEKKLFTDLKNIIG